MEPSLIQLFIAVPFFGMLISFLIPGRREFLLSRAALVTAGLQLAAAFLFIVFWLIKGAPVLNLPEMVLYHSENYEFLIDFYFDKVTAVYLFVGAFITFLIVVYSRYYLHREKGYKRFFNTILFFYLGYNLTIFSGNFETLFLGWELLGISSFLLIAFYRERYLPVRNAVRVFSIYRIGDVGILLAMWASHHLWSENVTFLKLQNYELVHEHLLAHSSIGVFVSLMILLAAAAKSAQLPFSSWLPRAMEGPTPSSAIFYGSLSVHFGAFLLLRTFSFWEHQTIVRVLIAFLGAVTSGVTYLIARTQPTIKSRIAYSSVAQIGLIFVEIALGWANLALIHFTGNAFLRTYQLLVSPSMVSYLIRDQFYHFRPDRQTWEDRLPPRLRFTLYALSLREFNLDSILNRFLFTPLKKLGYNLNFLRIRNFFLLMIPSFLFGVLLFLNQHWLPEQIHAVIPESFALFAVLMVFKAFSERRYPRMAWLLVVFSHLWLALSVSFNQHFDFGHVLIYLSGIIPGGIAGYLILLYLLKKEPRFFDLNRYYGHAYEYPGVSFLFLLCSLALMGFPITASFLGEDLIFSHIHENQIFLAVCSSFSFVFAGIALIRMYARIFLGPHIKKNHTTSIPSS
jgi:NADH:ubiquinone oxidoreductase subunit 5 (subunit L)/multisubunit Na+/H+ antiporter MnhA subunit